MRRDVGRLQNECFEVLVIGGGIHGAAIAWDASLRGLRVALIEQHDFSSGTTGNSLRIAHGGLRAIQQFALGKLRQSAREQAILFRIAPSYVQPLPCLIPIYRHSANGVAAFRAAFASSRLLTADIQRAFNSPLPAPRIVSPEEARTCFPGFDTGDRMEGGALWYDAQVPDIERLVLAFVGSAVESGAQAANYVRARRLIVERGTVTGVEATDQMTGVNFPIRARVVINAAGPWAGELAESGQPGSGRALPPRWAQGVNLIVDRPPPPVAIGIPSPWGADRDPVMGGHRYLFMTAWKGITLAGTSYRLDGVSGPSLLTQVSELIEEWNAASPSLQWKASEITYSHCGQLPLREGFQSGRSTALLDHSAVIEHGKQGLAGFLSVVGTKFTTARRLAEMAVDTALRTLGRRRQASRTSEVSLSNGSPQPTGLAERVRHAIREEMALTLEDVVTRRLGYPPGILLTAQELGQIANAASIEMAWSPRQIDEEIKQLLCRMVSGGATRAA